MKLIADTHTHTLACDHAYGTISENAAAAAQKGLRFLAMTEHTPGMPGGPSPLHFMNLRVIPNELCGVTILKGAEVNILNYRGKLDLTDGMMEGLDWVVASMHTPNINPGTVQQQTNGWLAVAENPLVDVIGHCGDGRYPFDHEPVIRAFAKHNKLVEINAHSFTAREASEINCPKIARLCAEHGVRIVVNSDAHFSSGVGDFAAAVEMLERIGFPEELIVNADYHRFLAVAKEKAGKRTMREHLAGL